MLCFSLFSPNTVHSSGVSSCRCSTPLCITVLQSHSNLILARTQGRHPLLLQLCAVVVVHLFTGVYFYQKVIFLTPFSSLPLLVYYMNPLEKFKIIKKVSTKLSPIQ